MRKLKLQVQLSINGYVAGPAGEMDWMEWNWDEELNKYVADLTATMDTIIMGRKLAEGFIPYWGKVAANADDPEQPFGKIMTDTPKIVFSHSLQKSLWENTRLATAPLSEEITRLKNEPGKDIIVYGGAAFVTSLIEQNLIDEYHLFISPVTIEKGMTIFTSKTNLKLINTTAFKCGIVVLQYEPLKNEKNEKE